MPESRSSDTAPPAGHGPFAVGNATLNHAVTALVKAPVLHHVCSHYIALITVTGRRTNRRFTIPVLYRRHGDTVTIPVGWPARKLWWQNFRGAGAPVQLTLAGCARTGHATAHGDPDRGVKVTVELD